MTPRIDPTDARLLQEFQREFPLVPAPFAAIAAALGLTETEAIARLRRLRDEGKIARVGATVRPNTAGASTLAALAVPRLLAPANRLWMKFGLLLHRVTNPLIMGLLFYLTVTPTALIMRALGKDPLSLRLDPEARTYWIDRDPPGPSAESMTDQF